MKAKKIGVIIQARMGSTRLPGKVLKKLYEEDTVLDVLIKRLKLSKKIHEIIIATTPDICNRQIIEKAVENDVAWFIGDEKHVLKRYHDAAKAHQLALIIRLTSDCPFVDPFIIDDMISYYYDHDFDYLRNVDNSTNFSRGFEIEIFSAKVLYEIYHLAESKLEKEHVTYYIYTHPKKFKIGSYNIKNLKFFEDLRLTIDQENDLILCRDVLKRVMEKGFRYNFTVFDVISIIEQNPQLLEINRDVKHKFVTNQNLKK